MPRQTLRSPLQAVPQPTGAPGLAMVEHLRILDHAEDRLGKYCRRTQHDPVVLHTPGAHTVRMNAELFVTDRGQ